MRREDCERAVYLYENDARFHTLVVNIVEILKTQRFSSQDMDAAIYMAFKKLDNEFRRQGPLRYDPYLTETKPSQK